MLMPGIDKCNVIGIRIPILRKYAKSLKDYDDFLGDLPHKYYEENNLHAFLIEREQDFTKCTQLLDIFLPFVDNWATCDSMKPRAIKNEPEKLLINIKKWIEAKEVYAVRYAINLLMSLYLDENFKIEYHKMVAGVKSEEYYINMMRAWYFATALAKRYEETVPFLEERILDKWTHNKTIQKAIESLRLTKEKKEYLKSLKYR